jgi:uncharacterized protein (DUF1778 family)
MTKRKPDARMGRPPKAPEEKQSERVTVRMTREERRALEREAGEAGLSLAAYLLDCWKKRRR